MSALELVRAGGRSLDRRLDSVPAEALLAGLRAAGAVSEPEVAALGRPGSSGWVRRLRALAVARGDRSCQALLTVLEGLEGPPRPGPFDFYDPQRDAAPGHRSDCPCCRPEGEWTREEEEGATGNDNEGPEEEEGETGNDDEGPEEEEGETGNDDEGPEEEEGGTGNGEEGHEEEEGETGNDDEGPEEEEGGDEGREDEEGEPRNEDEGPDDDDGGGDEGHDDDDDEGPEDDDDGGGGDEGPDDDDGDGGGGDED